MPPFLDSPGRARGSEEEEEEEEEEEDGIGGSLFLFVLRSLSPEAPSPPPHSRKGYAASSKLMAGYRACEGRREGPRSLTLAFLFFPSTPSLSLLIPLNGEEGKRGGNLTAAQEREREREREREAGSSRARDGKRGWEPRGGEGREGNVV